MTKQTKAIFPGIGALRNVSPGVLGPDGKIHYGSWTINYEPNVLRRSWTYVHDEYTGNEDPRAGRVGSLAEAFEDINGFEGAFPDDAQTEETR